jgi:type III secretion protein N (ATPase)
VIVLALVGERGREVREFLDRIFDDNMRKRAIVVVATSDRSPLERYKAAYVATTIAEYFRDQGKNVLLLVDSVTRYARAARQLSLAAGEPMAANGYPPSVFASLPRLLERAGPAKCGVITGMYTVLVEGDDMNEPVADEVRSILDGHIVLSRTLAERNHYPAIDILRSVSRVMTHVAPMALQEYAGKLRRLLSRYDDIDLLVRVGEYQRGNDLEADEALDKRASIMRFLCQAQATPQELSDTQDALEHVVEG